MQTLTYGFQLPQTGDKGSVFFPGLEANIAQLDAHTHNGINSPLLNATALVASFQILSSASWVLVGNGIYRQLITLPVGMDFETKLVKYLFNTGAAAGQTVYPKEEAVTTNTFYVYLNDNTVDLKVSYL